MKTHALPGMGADSRMYPAAWSRLPGFVAHDWISHSGEASIEEVAKVMADRCDIEDGDDLIGTSLGGIVACEIASLRRLRRLILVGSAVSPREVSPLLALLHPLAQIAPLEWIRVSAGKIPYDLAQMFAGVDAGFVRAMCRAIFKWEGLRSSEAQLIRIHGAHDLVVPAPPKVDLLLDGGHLISITHAQQCAAFISPNPER